nr:zinc finger MYM-type protein 1-like [Nothobranchius furzeri]
MDYSIHNVLRCLRISGAAEAKKWMFEKKMKRSFPSGSEKHKKKEESKKFVSTLPKVTDFFTVLQQSTNKSRKFNAANEQDAAASIRASNANTFSEVEEPVAGSSSCGDGDNKRTSRQLVSISLLINQCAILEDDSALWPKELTDKERCSIVQKGPVKVKDRSFPKNQEGRRFTVSNCYLQMRNGEKIARSWLMYSESKDCIMCFCCSLFRDRDKITQLSGDGFNNWKNVAAHLKQHERSTEHITNMQTWHALLHKLQTNTAIDQVNQDLIAFEVNRWKEILKRLLAIVNHLAERNLAFRGHSEKLFESGNENFLGQVELMAQFGPVMQDHLRRIQKKEISDSYLSKDIQNELISLVAKCTTDAVVERMKRAKYYAVIMDCTPDLSHKEQLSVVLRIVNCELSKGVSVHEHFVGFLQAHDTTGKGLCESFLGHLEKLDLDLSNCRGQSHDNGSNMQGKKQGVQKRVLELNSKALCVPCGSHTLNLIIGDAAKSSLTSISFFGLLQRLYTLFIVGPF